MDRNYKETVLFILLFIAYENAQIGCTVPLIQTYPVPTNEDATSVHFT